MKQCTLFYDKGSGRYNFHYIDEDGDKRDYGGIHCGEVCRVKRKENLRCQNTPSKIFYVSFG